MTALRNRFGSIGARLGAGAGAPGSHAGHGFLGWWGQALASWLPLRARRALGMDRGRLLLQVEGEGVQLRLQQGDEVADLARLPVAADAARATGGPVDAEGDLLSTLLAPRTAALPRWLVLPAASALRRRLALPAGAADRLRDVVGFEIDRQTPFTAEAVAFDARIVGRRDNGQLDVELVAVPRAALAGPMEALGPLAATLAGIDVAGADGIPLSVNLLAPVDRRRHRDPWKRWNWLLAAVALLAFAALLWQLLENRRIAAETFEQRIAAQAQAGRAAAAQRQQLTRLVEGQVFLDAARAARPSAVEVLDELARRLPDGTYLEKLSIEDDRLMLIGLSNEAPALVGRLQDSGLWRSPALAGALQPDPASGRDRFTLVAELGQSPAPTGADSPPARPARAPAPAPEDADAPAVL